MATQVYKEQRRPSFLKDIGRRATEMAEATAKATRRISIHGNNGQGFELVAIGVSLEVDYRWWLLLPSTGKSGYRYVNPYFLLC